MEMGSKITREKSHVTSVTSTFRNFLLNTGLLKSAMTKLLHSYQWTMRRLHTALKDAVWAGLLYIVVLMLLYAPVVFLGRSLQAPLATPFGVTDSGAYGYEGRLPVANFGVDIASPAYMEWPLGRLQGELLREGKLPFWNPYQGGGMPLAAQPDSRAFFPYQIVENMSPVGAQDFFLLGRLWLAGLFTFLFLRRLRLSQASAFSGGLFYMLSGTFTVFINLEQMVNAAMVIPLLMWAVEGLWHWSWRRGVTALAIAIALVLMAGSPEAAVYIFILGLAFAIFNLAATPEEHRWLKIGGGLVAGGLGLALASVTMVPLVEFFGYMHSLHTSGGLAGVVNPADPTFTPQVLMPILYRDPVGVIYYLSGGGRWDDFGGYIGILPIYLLITGLTLGFLLRKSRFIKLLIFFAAFGLLILLKNFGFPPVSWIGHLPLLDQVWSNRWAGGTWTFSLAVAGAIGLEIIRERAWGTPLRWQHVGEGVKWGSRIGVILLVALLVASPFMVSNYQGDLIGMGIVMALAVLVTALLLTRHLISTRSGVAAFAALGMVELWFAIPMGYEPGWLWLRFLPVAAGLFAVFALAWQWRRWALVGALVSVLLILLVDLATPYGLPQRYDPATSPPYAQFLKERTENYARITGGNGVLMPNFAGSLHLYDVRYIGPAAPEWYQNLHLEHLHRERLWPYTNTSLWFTGYPDMDVNSQGTKRTIGVSFWADIMEKLPWYSLLGVRYILDEPSSSPPENIISNGGFETWDTGPGPFTRPGPMGDSWHLDPRGESTISVVRSKGEGGTGYAMTITYVHDKQSFVSYVVPEPQPYLDRAVAFSVSVEVKTNIKRAVRAGIWTGVASFSDYHPGDGQWHTLVVTYKPPQAPLVNDQLVALIVLDDSAVVYVDNAALWVGSPPPMYDLELPLVYDGEVRIYENPDAFPRAFVAHGAVFADSYREAQQVVSKPDFDARHKVVLEEPLPDNWTALVNVDLAPTEDLSEASIVDYQTDRVEVEARLSQPGILVLTDTYYPGWTARVDGAAVPIYRVDGVFRGVLLSEGHHTIVFSYFPRSYAIGFGVSGVALVICLGLVWARIPRRKKDERDVNRDAGARG
jgi:hypothetical protein